MFAMSSEFTLDIQLTELGFPSWNFPLSEPQSVKETFLPMHNGTEKSAPETEPLANCHEDTCVVPSASHDENFLQDSEYSSPIKHNSTINTQTSQKNSTIITEDNREKNISNNWRTKNKSSWTELKNNDKEQSREEEKKTEKEQRDSEVIEEAACLVMDDMSGEEITHDAEFDLTDDDYDDDEEEEEEEVVKEDDSCSEANGSGDNEEHHCHVCDLTFTSLFLLQEHLNMHTGARPYRCDECGKQFCQLINYRAHLLSHSQKASIHCHVCSTIFETEEQLQKHLDTNHFERQFYQCDFCKQIFTNLEVCQDHVETHRQQAKQHMLRHLELHSRGGFSCLDCERTFFSKAALLHHSFTHVGVLPYTCLKCKRHFRLPSLYHNHECKPEHIQCMACLVFFQSQEDFERHKKDTGCWGHQGVLPTKTDEIRCMECGQIFASIEELKKHASTHQRVLKCAECGMGFRSALMLMSHMGGHAGQRPCLCKDCGLGFPHQQGYDSHLKTCGLETPPVAAAKKPRLKEAPSSQRMKPIAPSVFFKTVAQGSNPATFSHSMKDQNKPTEGVRKLSLNKELPPGMPQVSSLVLDTPSSAPSVISMPVVPPSPVDSAETRKDIVEQSKTNIPSDIFIPMESDYSSSKKRRNFFEDKSSIDFGMENLTKVGEPASGEVEPNRELNVTTHLEAENELKSKSKAKPNALIDEKVDPLSSSDTASLNPMNAKIPLCIVQVKEIYDDNIKKRSSSLKPHDSSPVMPGVERTLTLKIKAETQTPESSVTGSYSLVHGSSEITLEKDQIKKAEEVVSSDRMFVKSEVECTWMGDKSENWLQGGTACAFDLDVEINDEMDSSSMEVEIGDEDSGVDMLEGELHECVTCGNILPEKDMVQHYMMHAAVSDSHRRSPIKCGSDSADQCQSTTPPCSLSRKRQNSGTKL
ncbi:zinc finger protein 615-like isoform X2 [Myxocyprinus asiaticus]|uniref:zinc finger protein 615-like isoform X2 n=1 Tax=Myxocyprinus asiaticus TaxID=70543 RepID=UPI0022227995|nr:zinc finger protein 615-like isoform X2 [Myxocyprinus asiaticus]